MVNKRTLDYFYVLVQQRLNVGDDLNQSSCTVSEKYVRAKFDTVGQNYKCTKQFFLKEFSLQPFSLICTKALYTEMFTESF